MTGSGDGSFTIDTRALIVKRARGRCEVCGLMAMSHQIHHRRPRGMGGTNRAATESPANGLFVHPSCHARIESSRQAAVDCGWIVSQQQDPAAIPVLLAGRWWLLDDDGGLSAHSRS